jgi:hypothetical protein
VRSALARSQYEYMYEEHSDEYMDDRQYEEHSDDTINNYNQAKQKARPIPKQSEAS